MELVDSILCMLPVAACRLTLRSRPHCMWHRLLIRANQHHGLEMFCHYVTAAQTSRDASPVLT